MPVFLNKKYIWKWETLTVNIFLNSTVGILKLLRYLGKRYIVKMYFKKKLNEIEIKMQKFRNISISQIPTKPDRNYKQIIITCIICRYLYFLYEKLFTNEVDLLRKLVS